MEQEGGMMNEWQAFWGTMIVLAIVIFFHERGRST